MAVREEKREGRGRAMVAAEDLRGGQVLLKEKPILVYQEEEAEKSSLFCAHCMRCLALAGKPLPCCPRCYQVCYCSRDCLLAAEGSSHTRRVCKALSLLEESDLSVDSRTQARYLIAAYNLGLEDPVAFKKLERLEGQEYVDDAVRDLHEFLMEALQGSDVESLGFSVDVTGALLAKDACNAFGIMAPDKEAGERKVRGYAIYAQASLFNHDCLPNACRFEHIDRPEDGNTDLYIRALHDIREGTEVCLSYFPINWPYKARQKKLEEEYGFQCKCERCKVERNWTDEESAEQDEDEGQVDRNEESGEGSAEEGTNGDEFAELQKGAGDADDDDDFAHAMFFVKYLCPIDDCGGTMAPLSSQESDTEVEDVVVVAMECNSCGHIRSKEEFLRDLEEHSILE